MRLFYFDFLPAPMPFPVPISPLFFFFPAGPVANIAVLPLIPIHPKKRVVPLVLGEEDLCV